jgi:acetylornithine deacetylase/succinyl-diaminopimelate desuccinylase-like protein
MIDGGKLKQRIADLAPAFEERLTALCGIPSVSMDPGRRAEMGACAKLGADLLREAGAQVDTIDTGGYPMVVGRFFQDAAFPTVTVYNHLDVQPADGEGWRTPPFKLTRAAQGNDAGPARWFARGATDDKGPALTALYGARLAIENGVRANIQFLWELEEEIGSPHFAAGLDAAVAGDAAAGRAPLQTDSVVVSDTIWIAAGQPSISYGLRGLMGFTVALETGAKDVHSGTTGGLARNPIGELAALVAECYDARTGQGEDPRLLRRRAQAVGGGAQGVRARAVSHGRSSRSRTSSGRCARSATTSAAWWR